MACGAQETSALPDLIAIVSRLGNYALIELECFSHIPGMTEGNGKQVFTDVAQAAPGCSGLVLPGVARKADPAFLPQGNDGGQSRFRAPRADAYASR